MQAACAEPLLRAKVLTWAAASGGLFPVQKSEKTTAESNVLRPVELEISESSDDNKYLPGNDPSVAAVGDAEAGIEGRAQIKWPRLKTTSRATEKLVRSYGQAPKTSPSYIETPSSRLPRPLPRIDFSLTQNVK